ncbi:MAG: BamA/TamA family outer membrane protein [Rikenellaceae bacterium]
MRLKHTILQLLLLLLPLASALAQDQIASDSTVLSDREIRVIRRDSVRATKRVWTTFLGGPSYTPEASVGVAGAVLLSFRVNPKDSLSQRSFLPMGVNASINGTVVVAGSGTLFFKENRLRLYTNYGMRNEPSNFYGVGFDEIDANPGTDATTIFTKTNVYFSIKPLFEVCPKLYVGTIFDLNYSGSRDLNDFMLANEYVDRYSLRYTNIGLGAILQYDSRDDVATPNSGVMISATAKLFSRAFGGTYNYQFVDLEYRQFKPLFRRSVLGWVARAQTSYGDVPFTDLPTFGSPFDLRGYYWGKYRDRSMGYGIVEYRQMLGSREAVERKKLISRFGYVAWVGAGTLGATPAYWDEWKLNYGFGVRAQIQPRKNFRLDVGRGVGDNSSWLVYFNMTEAF